MGFEALAQNDKLFRFSNIISLSSFDAFGYKKSPV